MELRGVSCLKLEELVPPKQQIMSSRSFGEYVYTLAELEEAVSTYTARVAEKQRAQGSVAGAIQVFIRTNPFKPEHPQYQRGLSVPPCPPPAPTRAPSPVPRCGDSDACTSRATLTRKHASC